MKKTLLLLMLTSLVVAANAQRVSRSRTGQTSSGSSVGTSHFGLGVEAGLPFGEIGKTYSVAAGGNLQYEYLPDPELGLTVNAGYLHFARKKDYGGGHAGFIPVLGGVKYYFTPGAFFHAQLGAAFGTVKDIFGNRPPTSFAYSPGIGIKLSPNIDATLKYTGFSTKGGTIETVAARLGVNF